MANSSVNSNGNVLSYHEENKPREHLSDRFTIVSSNGSIHYDKEMVKRTMLVHEATFQKQVYELHRLYKIQKDLMAQFQREEFNAYPRYEDTLQTGTYASQSSHGDVKGVRQTGNPVSGHDLNTSSIDFMNKSTSQYIVNGAPLRHNNDRSKKIISDLQLPIVVYANDDDDVKILYKKPSKRLSKDNGYFFGGNVKLNLGNSEGSSHVGKSWNTNVQAHHSSTTNMLNKPVEESSNVKRTNFLAVGTSVSQKEHVPQGVNLNLLNLEGNLKERCVGNVSGSRFFGANEEIKHNNSFGNRKDDSNASMAWLKCKQNYTDSSVGHYLSSASTSNELTLASPGFNYALNSPWQSNNTNSLTKSHYGAVETPIAKHAISNGILMDSTPKTLYHHSLKIHEETQCRKLPPVHDYLKGINLNNAPADTIGTWECRSENSVYDISWVRKKLVNLMKPQVSSSCANGYSQIVVNPMLYSESRSATRIPNFPISADAKKDSECSPTLQYDLNIGPSFKHEPDMEMQPQNKKADIEIRNLIDLNEALPIMDDPSMNARESECDIVPHEPNNPSRCSLAITAAESLVAISNVVIQPGSPQLDTLHWFANLATSKENIMFDNDSDNDFEALTLKLLDTENNDYHSTPRNQEDNSKNNHCSVASLLVSKPQRGKVQGCRQKKEFQKDVLLGLVALPKHDMSDDLQNLGRSMAVTPTKRGGQNRQKPRGRRRARSVAITMEEARVSPLPALPSLVPNDLDGNALGITKRQTTTRS